MNGLLNSTHQNKMEQVIFEVKEMGADITLLQETHIHDEATKNRFKRNWPGKCIFDYGTNRARGVAILFSEKRNWILDSIRKDGTGRLIILSVKQESIKFELVCLYGPNGKQERKDFYEELNINMGMMGIHIVGGDFNFHEYINDKKGGNPDEGLEGKEEMEIIKKRLQHL